MNDIDTQIESARTAFWEKMTNLVLEYDLYTFNPNIKEMERDLMNAYDKAIKTLLIQQIDDALARQATPTALSKQADNHCVDCGKDLRRCENCERLWQK